MPGDTIIKTIGLPDRFIEHGDRDILLDRCGLSVDRIKETIISYVTHRDRQGKM